MSESDRTDDSWSLGRRTALKLAGGLVLGSGFAGTAVAGGRERTKRTCYVEQDGETYEIEPLSGDVPVQKLYDYRLPEKYEGVGVTSSEGPHYRSLGTKALQKEATSIMFLYDGPDGLSLVVVHGRPGGAGGSASWKVTSVPDDAEWAVKDDLYVDADTGERASSNYDKWDTDGSTHRIDWTWGAHGTDGGALSDLGKEFSLTVRPAFNEDAELYEKHYEGDVEDWQVLSGDLDHPDRTSLELDEPVTIGCETMTQKQSWTQTWDDDDHGDDDHRRDRKHGHDDEDEKRGRGRGRGHRNSQGRGHDKGRGRGHDEGRGYQRQSQSQSQTQVQSGGRTQVQSQSQSQTQVQSGGSGTQIQSQSQSQTQIQKLLSKVTDDD